MVCKEHRYSMISELCILQFSSVQFGSVQLLSRIPLFATPWITARQASLSITNSWNLLKLMPIESVMPSSHLILCIVRPFQIEVGRPEFGMVGWKLLNLVGDYTSSFPNVFPSPRIHEATVAQMAKNLPKMQETQVWSLGWENSPGEGNGNLLEYYCLGNPVNGEDWQATIHGVTKSQMWLSD